jgi:zinc protease
VGHVQRLLGLNLIFALLVQPAYALPSEMHAPVFATLPNGLRIVVISDNLAPVVSVTTTYLAGSAQEAVAGTAHAQEHMMFRGSESVSEGQFAETAAAMGGAFNASTQAEFTQFSFEVPARDLPVVLRLERSRAAGILDSRDAWVSERSAVLQEVAGDASSANFRLLDRASRAVFSGTPYENYGLGSFDSVQGLHTSDLKTFYDRWYLPNNMLIVVIGDVNAEAAVSEIRSAFSDLTARKLPQRRDHPAKPMKGETFRDFGSDPFGLIFAAYRSPGFRDPDYFASLVLNGVLESERGPLFDIKTRGRALQTFAQSIVHPQIGMTLVGCVVPVTRKPESALGDIDAALAGFRDHGIPDDLIDASKKRAILALRLAANSVSKRGALWATMIAREERTPLEDSKRIETVTSAEVNAVLRKYLFGERVIAIATQASSTGSIAGRLPPEKIVVMPSAQSGLPSFAESIVSDRNVSLPSRDVRFATLGNGLKVVVVPRLGSGTITLRGIVLSNPGIAVPAGKEGMDRILDGLFSLGTARADKLTFEEEADKIGAFLGAGATFSLDVEPTNFDRGVQLLAEKQLSPDLGVDAFELIKRQLSAAVQGEAASGRDRADRSLAFAIYPPGDPARRFASTESISRVTVDDVREYYQRVFQPGNTTFVVIGDIEPDRALDVIQTTFGKWAPAGQRPEIYPPAIANNTTSTTELRVHGAGQANVTLAESLSVTYDHADYPALQLMNAALSGGFSTSLLFKDLRQTSGIAYRVESSLSGGKNRSRFAVSFGCAPERVNEAISIVRRDLESLQTSELSAERLGRIKAQLLSRLALEDESFDGIANTMLTYVATGRPTDESYRLALLESALTPKDVLAAAKRWIRPADLAVIVVAPEP